MRGHIVDLEEDEDENESTEESEEEESEQSDSTDAYSEFDDEADFKEHLRWCLDDVKHEGTFSSFQHHTQYPNPGLHVNGLGVVGLPLSDRDAKAIAALCKQSPFGRGDETVVDESVRKTWELNASQITCDNPAWAAFERIVTDQAIMDIGVQVTASAQPYKLLLYEQGAFFKAHRDTEKVPGMFGTMVICLPSEHTGGEVLLNHGCKQQILQTAATSAFDISTLAWYSDVQHTIKPILSGYRLVLTYNLVQDQNAQKPTATALDNNHDKLARLLGAWNRNYDYQDHLIYPLSFKYTEDSLSMNNLKGDDIAKGRYLEHVCSDNGVYWFLSQMTRSKEEDEYYAYHESDGEHDTHELGETFLPSGCPINLGLNTWVDEGALLASMDEIYGTRNPDSGDEGEYTGNENMPSTLRYHDSVVILMRKDRVLLNFKIRDKQSPDSLLAYFDLISSDTACEPMMRQEALTAILEKAVALAAKKDDGYVYQTIRVFGYGHVDPEMKRTEYAKAFETVADYCNQNGHGALVSKLIRSAMDDKTWTSSKSVVGLVARQVAIEASNGKGNVWSDWFSTPLPSPCTYTYANQQREAYDEVRHMLPTTSTAAFDEWKTARIEEIIRAVQSYSHDDAESIVNLVPTVAPPVYFESIIPTLIKRPDAAGLSRFLYLLATRTVISQEHFTKPTYERLSQTAKACLKLPLAAITGIDALTDQVLNHNTRTAELLGIVECYIDLGHEQLAAELLGACLPDVPGVTSGLWKEWKLMFQFLESVATVLMRHDIIHLHDSAKPFFNSVLQTAAEYINHSKPEEPLDWAQEPLDQIETRFDRFGGYCREKCSCEPCNALRLFVADPKERIGRFSYPERTRKHLQYQLDFRNFEFDTEKKRSPHTLVVTKTRNKHKSDLREWQNSINAMRTYLDRLDTLLEPLGLNATTAADLDAQLGSADTKARMPATRPLQPTAASARNSRKTKKVAGTKRKADVIDLTEDS